MVEPWCHWCVPEGSLWLIVELWCHPVFLMMSLVGSGTFCSAPRCRVMSLMMSWWSHFFSCIADDVISGRGLCFPVRGVGGGIGSLGLSWGYKKGSFCRCLFTIPLFPFPLTTNTQLQLLLVMSSIPNKYEDSRKVLPHLFSVRFCSFPFNDIFLMFSF